MGKKDGAYGRVATRASLQYGVISFDQLVECGIGPRTIYDWVHSKRLSKLFPGVFAIGGTRVEWMQRLSGAVLWAGPGSAVAGAAAAELHRFDAGARKTVEIIVPYERNPTHRSVIVHRTRQLSEADLLTGHFPPRTNVGRTLVDLSETLSERDLERALDSSWRRRDQTLLWTYQAIHRLGARGRSSIPALSKLLNTRLNEPTDSDLEALLLPVFRDSPVPTPILHHRVQECPWFAPEIDFVWLDQKVGLMADGFKFHSRYRQWTTDKRIRRFLSDIGWQIVECGREDVLERPWEIVRSIEIRLGRTYTPLFAAGS